MPLQGHQQQRLTRALDHLGKELQGEWSRPCAIRRNEHDLASQGTLQREDLSPVMRGTRDRERPCLNE